MAALPIEDDLLQIPLRAILAYVARCARRIEPLVVYHPAFAAKVLPNVDIAIQIAEEFAMGGFVPVDKVRATVKGICWEEDPGEIKVHEISVNVAKTGIAAQFVAFAALHAINAVESLPPNESYCNAVVKNALRATDEACAAADHSIDAVISSDYGKLYTCFHETFRTLGQPIDLTDEGPIGPLWPEATPRWYQEGVGNLQKRLTPSIFKASRRIAELAVQYHDTSRKDIPSLNVTSRRAVFLGQSPQLDIVQEAIGERLMLLLGTLARNCARAAPQGCPFGHGDRGWASAAKSPLLSENHAC
jgi:hypothetical protein